MLYCVFHDEEIVGRFKRKEKAINCMLEFWFDGIEVTIKPMTKQEYREYMEEQIFTNLIEEDEE